MYSALFLLFFVLSCVGRLSFFLLVALFLRVCVCLFVCLFMALSPFTLFHSCRRQYTFAYFFPRIFHISGIKLPLFFRGSFFQLKLIKYKIELEIRKKMRGKLVTLENGREEDGQKKPREGDGQTRLLTLSSCMQCNVEGEDGWMDG